MFDWLPVYYYWIKIIEYHVDNINIQENSQVNWIDKIHVKLYITDLLYINKPKLN